MPPNGCLLRGKGANKAENREIPLSCSKGATGATVRWFWRELASKGERASDGSSVEEKVGTEASPAVSSSRGLLTWSTRRADDLRRPSAAGARLAEPAGPEPGRPEARAKANELGTLDLPLSAAALRDKVWRVLIGTLRARLAERVSVDDRHDRRGSRIEIVHQDGQRACQPANHMYSAGKARERSGSEGSAVGSPRSDHRSPGPSELRQLGQPEFDVNAHDSWLWSHPSFGHARSELVATGVSVEPRCRRLERKRP